MGDLRDWLPEAAASGVEKTAMSSTLSESKADNLQVAEDVTQGIIARIHPNSVSEQRRRAVIDYVKRLLGTYLGFEVDKNRNDQFQLISYSTFARACVLSASV